MLSSQPPERTYSVHALLPAELDRRLARWSAGMPGTSWPDWGGHVTLIPSFTTGQPVELGEEIAAVCRRHRAFQINLDRPITEQDYTRPDYFAVMLAGREPEDEGQAPLRALRRELVQSTNHLRSEMYAVVKDEAWIPHVTLALGVGQSEAERMVNQIRTDGLTVRFFVERIWLLEFSAGAEGRQITSTPFPLSGVVNIFAD